MRIIKKLILAQSCFIFSMLQASSGDDLGHRASMEAERQGRVSGRVHSAGGFFRTPYQPLAVTSRMGDMPAIRAFLSNDEYRSRIQKVGNLQKLDPEVDFYKIADGYLHLCDEYSQVMHDIQLTHKKYPDRLCEREKFERLGVSGVQICNSLLPFYLIFIKKANSFIHVESKILGGEDLSIIELQNLLADFVREKQQFIYILEAEGMQLLRDIYVDMQKKLGGTALPAKNILPQLDSLCEAVHSKLLRECSRFIESLKKGKALSSEGLKKLSHIADQGYWIVVDDHNANRCKDSNPEKTLESFQDCSQFFYALSEKFKGVEVEIVQKFFQAGTRAKSKNFRKKSRRFELLHKSIAGRYIKTAKDHLTRVQRDQTPEIIPFVKKLKEQYLNCLRLEASIGKSGVGGSSSNSQPPIVALQREIKKMDATMGDLLKAKRKASVEASRRRAQSSRAFSFVSGESIATSFTKETKKAAQKRQEYEAKQMRLKKARLDIRKPLQDAYQEESDASSSTTSAAVKKPASLKMTGYTYRSHTVSKAFKALEKGCGVVSKSLKKLLTDIKKDPFGLTGRGMPKAISTLGPHVFSRRINQKDRLVYRVDKASDGGYKIHILNCKGHYKQL